MVLSETTIRRDMDFLRVAAELVSPVHGASLRVDAGECNDAEPCLPLGRWTSETGICDPLAITYGVLGRSMAVRSVQMAYK